MGRVLHKITVDVDEKLWLAFKTVAVTQGVPIQRLVGELVEREARAAERRQAQRLGRSKAAKRAMDKALSEIEARG